MWETCPEFLRRSARPRLEPATSRSRIRRSTATPRRHQCILMYITFCLYVALLRYSTAVIFICVVFKLSVEIAMYLLLSVVYVAVGYYTELCQINRILMYICMYTEGRESCYRFILLLYSSLSWYYDTDANRTWTTVQLLMLTDCHCCYAHILLPCYLTVSTVVTVLKSLLKIRQQVRSLLTSWTVFVMYSQAAVR